jgi:hypothetical protein
MRCIDISNVAFVACNKCDVAYIACKKCDVAYITCNKCNVCDVWDKCKKICCVMTVQLSGYFLFEKGGTESLLEVFLHNNCEQFFFCLLTKKEMRSGTHFTQQNMFLPVPLQQRGKTRLSPSYYFSYSKPLREVWDIHKTPYWSFGDTIPVPTVARVHFLSSKLWYNTTSFSCHTFLLDNFWYLHTTIFEDTYCHHPKVCLHTSSMTRVWGECVTSPIPPQIKIPHKIIFTIKSK